MSSAICFGSPASVSSRLRGLSSQSRASTVAVGALIISGLAEDVTMNRVALLTQPDSELARIASELQRLSGIEIPAAINPVVTVLDLTTAGAPPFNATNAEITTISSFVVVIGTREELSANQLWLDLLNEFIERKALDLPNLHVFFDYSQDPNGSELACLVNSDLEEFAALHLIARGMKLSDTTMIEQRASSVVTTSLERRITELESTNSRLLVELLGLRDRVIGADSTAGTLQWRIDRLNGHIDHLQHELKVARSMNSEILGSRTFRIGRFVTLPLRLVRRILRKLTS